MIRLATILICLGDLDDLTIVDEGRLHFNLRWNRLEYSRSILLEELHG